MTNPKSVTLYACGGLGTNIVRAFESKFDDARSADLSIIPPQAFYIDTSDSNLKRPGVDQDRVFLFEGKDGSGKWRAENNPIIEKTMPSVLQKFEPSAFNIIISSGGGGSGSVIAHHLLLNLREMELPAVVILIGTTASLIEIKNSVKTLKSLDNIAHEDGMPLVCYYLENTPHGGRAPVDAAAIEALMSLVALFGGQHDELDSADLRHWLQYDDLGGELVALEIVRGREAYQQIKDVVSVATLAVPGDNAHLDPTPAYQAVGYVPDKWVSKFVTMGEPLSYCLSSDLVERASRELMSHEAEVDRVLTTRVRRDSLVTNKDKVSGKGPIL